MNWRVGSVLAVAVGAVGAAGAYGIDVAKNTPVAEGACSINRGGLLPCRRFVKANPPMPPVDTYVTAIEGEPLSPGEGMGIGCEVIECPEKLNKVKP